MSENTNQSIPAYTTYTSFSNLINNLKEGGLPSHVTRDVVPGSNSAKATMISSLKALGLVDVKDGSPTSDLRKLVHADSEQEYKVQLKSILCKQYPFLLEGPLDIKRTTTEKVAEQFKERGATGSTVTKGMSFFLAAAKAVDLEISPYVKVPKSLPRPRKAKPKPTTTVEKQADDASGEAESSASSRFDHLDGKDRIVVSAYGMEDWEIFVPTDLSDRQWQHGLKIAVFMLENYRQEMTAQDD